MDGAKLNKQADPIIKFKNQLIKPSARLPAARH